MCSISINSLNMSGKIWYTAEEAADIVVNLPDDNSPDTDTENEDESDIESDLPQPEPETETSETESSSASESLEKASAYSSDEEQQPALPNAQNLTQAEDALVPPFPHYEVNQQRSWTKQEKQETINTFKLP